MSGTPGHDTRLVECVPNLSEGRDPAVVDAIAAAVAATAGVHLLDRTSDADHHRSVLTFAGPATAVRDAMEAVTAAALARIDMRLHAGAHPRIGAVDVVPFVPLGTTTMDDCVALARDYGARVAERHGIPVFLYARAATRPERRILADIRRPQVEGLADFLATEAGVPDFGPRRAHPTAGAIVTGARPFLVAWNVDLDSDDVALARRIAGRVRARDGGLPGVQALGLHLVGAGRAQVSMNLLDTEATPIHAAFAAVEALAAEAGVRVHSSELIGLIPQAALLAAADHAGADRSLPVAERVTAGAAAVRMRDFHPGRVLELRLAAAEAAAGAPDAGPDGAAAR